MGRIAQQPSQTNWEEDASRVKTIRLEKTFKNAGFLTDHRINLIDDIGIRFISPNSSFSSHIQENEERGEQGVTPQPGITSSVTGSFAFSAAPVGAL